MKKTIIILLSVLFLVSCNKSIEKSSQIIDIEHHFLPTEFLEYLSTRTTPPIYDKATGMIIVREGIPQPIDGEFMNTGHSLKELWVDMGPIRIEQMDAAGVDVAVISSFIYELEEENAIYWARFINDKIAEITKNYPDRFMGAMCLPMSNIEAAVAEMKRCSDMGFKILCVQSNEGVGVPRLYDSIYEPILATAEKENISIFIHPAIPTEPTLLDNGTIYSSTGLGYGQDVMKTTYRLVTSGAFDRHPNLRIILGHYGEYLPFIMGRTNHMMSLVPYSRSKNKHGFAYYFSHHNIMVGTSGSFDENVFRCASQTIGNDNIMYASDYPFESYKPGTDAINSFDISDDVRKAIFSGNVMKYVLAEEPCWEPSKLPEQELLAPKTPTVRGYDFEHHYYIPEFYEVICNRTEPPYINRETNTIYLRDSIYGRLPNKMKGEFASGDILSDFSKERVADMDKAKVEVALISSSDGVAALPEEQAIQLCKMSNDRVLKMQKDFPDRIMGQMILPVPYVDASIAEMQRCAAAGFKVWHVFSNYQIASGEFTYIYEDKYEPLLAEAEKLGIRIYLHPNTPADEDFQDNGCTYACAGLGYCSDAMRTAVRLVLNGTFDRHPDLRLIMAHLGEYFPYVLERIDNRFTYQPDPFVKNKKSFKYYFENHNLMASTSGIMSIPAFECLKNEIGIDNIVFGADYPYENYSQQADFVRSLDLTQEELDKIWGLNAEKYILN